MRYTEGSRLQSILVDMDFFIRNPLFGANLSSVIYSVEFNTTSTMVLFAAFGMFVGGFHVLSWMLLVWNRNNSLVVNLILLFILFMSFNTQNLLANQFFWIFPVLAVVERVVPKLNFKR